MFSTLETAIREHLAGCIAGVQVNGTWDYVDMAREGAPVVAMQVEYQGFDALENRPGAVTLGHRFAVHVYVDAGRSRDAQRTAAEAGLQEAVKRMLAWPDDRLRVEIGASPVSQFEGRTLRLSMFFSIAPMVVTA